MPVLLLIGVVSMARPATVDAAPGRPRVLLIGDSTLAALAWYPKSQAGLSGLNYVLDAQSCRAVTAQSCVGRTDPRTGRRIRPANALTVLRSHPAGSFDELVLMVGYDESYTNFRHSVVAMTQAARDHGIDHVTWLTFRTDVSYVPPLDAERDYSYRSNNSLLRAQAQNSGGFISLLDWNGHVNSRSGLVERDGVHLTAAGAASAARLIRDAVLAHWGSSAASAGPAPGGTVPVALRDRRPQRSSDVALRHDRRAGEGAPAAADRDRRQRARRTTGSPVGSTPSPNAPCASSSSSSATATMRRWSSTASSVR